LRARREKESKEGHQDTCRERSGSDNQLLERRIAMQTRESVALLRGEGSGEKHMVHKEILAEFLWLWQ